jgi:hypothetical protein
MSKRESMGYSSPATLGLAIAVARSSCVLAHVRQDMEQQFYNDNTIARAHAEDEFFQQPRSRKRRRNYGNRVHQTG